MIRHLFRLVWNRRRANALILVEVFLSFLVLCWVLTDAASKAVNYLEPLGFEYRDVWSLSLRPPQSGFSSLEDEDRPRLWSDYQQIRLAVEAMDEVEALSPMDVNYPFTSSMSGYHNFVDGRLEFIASSDVAVELKEILGLKLVEGRWLEPGDEAQPFRPVVLTKVYAEALYPDGDAVGQRVVTRRSATELAEWGTQGVEVRIVGVVEDFRNRGELFGKAYAEFTPERPFGVTRPPQTLLLKMRAGAPLSLEEELLRVAHRVAPEWTVGVLPLETARQRGIRDWLTPLILFGTVGLFLILMVGLGLVGVLWQSVSRRTKEWGLRMALGATPGEVRLQVLGELLALTTIAVAVGALLYVQLPLIGALGRIPAAAWTAGLGLSIAVVYLVVLACGLYPSWLATRVRPAEALQHE